MGRGTTDSPAPPLPRYTDATVAIEAPGDGPGYWAGAPSVAVADGIYYLAYRLRRPIGEGRGYANVVARSEDGVTFETLTVLERGDFGAESLERPALVQLADGGWRLYVSSDIPAAGGWHVDALDAADPSGFDPKQRRRLIPGAGATSVKDPYVLRDGDRWHMWICDGASPVAYYDGRATAAENYEERTGVAFGNGPSSFAAATFVATDDAPAAVSPYGSGSLRYLTLLRPPEGGYRLYYEATRADGAHQLRTEYLPPA